MTRRDPDRTFRWTQRAVVALILLAVVAILVIVLTAG